MIKTLYLVGSNNGDGSLSIQVYDDRRIAEWHENHDNEGFFEPSMRELKIESNGPIKVECITPFQYYLNLVDYGTEEHIVEFKKDFGSEFPEYSLKETEVEKKKDGYKKVRVMVNGESIHYFFVQSKEKLEHLRKCIDTGISRTY